MQQIDIVLASPRGFCAGVVRAIETVRLTLKKVSRPVYVLHEIVHNRHVIKELEARGVHFVVDLSEIPEKEICIFSAHGVSVDIEKRAERLGLVTIDATCPLVTSIHRMVEQYQQKGYEVIIIGHHGHPEVVGTAGRVTGGVHIVADTDEAETVVVRNPEKVAYVTQTTLSQQDSAAIRAILKKRFKHLTGPNRSNICYATQNRQNAVQTLARSSDLIFVVGSKNSSNSNRLKEVAVQSGCRGYLIDDYRDIDPVWLEGVHRIGITAGASAPERLVDGVLSWLNEHFVIRSIREMDGKEEKISFRPVSIDQQ
ncbi:MAG: 4-hydroxy-3-methylbut-2-enyl diphosphate reductase [Proteobacteria bacterium]|nr:MAG: 4-hydroxy-3-methylbut-2-enyl diphosphate reductase [Pseudomonadota bacterium]